MNYDWNKYVTITVPKGLNGWVYSGNVTINGIKVEFPVGVETSVPEPAAAMLNAMMKAMEDNMKVPAPSVGNGCFVLEATIIHNIESEGGMHLVCSPSASFHDVVKKINNNILTTLKVEHESMGAMFIPLVSYISHEKNIMFYAEVEGIAVRGMFSMNDIGEEMLVIDVGGGNS